MPRILSPWGGLELRAEPRSCLGGGEVGRGTQDLGGGRPGGGSGNRGAGQGMGPGEVGGGLPRTSVFQHRGQRPDPEAPGSGSAALTGTQALGCSKPALGSRRGRKGLGPRHSGPLSRPGPATAMLLEAELAHSGDRPGAAAAAAVCTFRGTQGESLAPPASSLSGRAPRGDPAGAAGAGEGRLGGDGTAHGGGGTGSP